MIILNKEFYDKFKDLNRKPSDIDRVIAGFIQSVKAENYNEVIKAYPREEVQFHLGAERDSSVSWYPFKSNATILEVGGEFGAVTGILCERAERVVVTETSAFRAAALCMRHAGRDNLQVYAGQADEIIYPYKFDYIVILNMLEKIGNHAVMDTPYIRILEYLQEYLKPDGIILLADENLYSIKNCQNGEGALNPWVHMQFLYKEQVRGILDKCGFSNIRFYYPLPGYNLVGRIYSDNALPSAAEWNILTNYGGVEQNFMANNMDLLQKLSDNGMFPYLAPAFLAEAGRMDNLSGISKVNVLAGENIEIPSSGFNWTENGVGSFANAIENYRIKASEIFNIETKYQAAVLKIDLDYEVIQQVLTVELELLKKLYQVCSKHNLKIYLMYGTLLGAVRNAGVIPGDDDIDVAMMREDYDKLLSLESEFLDDYFLQTPGNDNCFFGGYLKLRNKNTTAIHPQNWWVNCCEGIGIDIFPMDSGYIDKRKELKKRKQIIMYQRLLYAKAYGYFPRFLDMKMLKWKTYKYIGKLFSRQQLAEKLNKVLTCGDSEKEAPLAIYAHYLAYREPVWLNRMAFKKKLCLKFEDMSMDVPYGWDIILKALYGNQYMEPSPWHENKRRHGFYNAKVSYDIYKKRFAGLFHPIPSDGQEIVLFGDKCLFELYLKKYNNFMPSRLVMVNQEDTLNIYQGIQIESLETFKAHKNENIYLIICSLDIRAAEELLQHMGYYDYYIFLHAREWMQLANWTYAMRELEE